MAAPIRTYFADQRQKVLHRVVDMSRPACLEQAERIEQVPQENCRIYVEREGYTRCAACWEDGE